MTRHPRTLVSYFLLLSITLSCSLILSLSYLLSLSLSSLSLFPLALRLTNRALDMSAKPRFLMGKLHGPRIALGMVRVFLDVPKIRSEMAGISNDSRAYQMQCAILAVFFFWWGCQGQRPSNAKVACSYHVGNTGPVVQDLCMIRTQSSRRGRSEFWLAWVGCLFFVYDFFVGQGGCTCTGGEPRWLPFSFVFPTSLLTTATTRRSRPSRANTALPLQSGPPSSPTLGRGVASSSHCQPMGPKELQARS